VKVCTNKGKFINAVIEAKAGAVRDETEIEHDRDGPRRMGETTALLSVESRSGRDESRRRIVFRRKRKEIFSKQRGQRIGMIKNFGPPNGELLYSEHGLKPRFKSGCFRRADRFKGRRIIRAYWRNPISHPQVQNG